MNKATEIINRYARRLSSPFGETWHVTYKGQSFNSPSKTGLIEQVHNAITQELPK